MTPRLVVSGCLAGFVVLSTGVHAQTKDRGMTVFVTAAGARNFRLLIYLVMTSLPSMYGRSAVGTTTVPSFCW